MSSGRVVIDVERCKGCYLCQLYCPRELIVVSGEINSSGYHPVELEDMERCTGCSFCADICPDLAIEVYREQ